MRTRYGFTLIELLVVIAIIAILASILFPVFAKARAQARKIVCTSQVRQLAMAVQMYVQDNNSRYPGKDWHTAIENYAGSNKIFFCPADAANDKNAGGNISYGYSGLLVRTDGSGCNEGQVASPSEVGAIADATPTRAWSDGGGLIGGGALTDPATVDANRAVELDPRHDGVLVGYADGHAKFLPGRVTNLKDIANPAGRAFYGALGYGLVRNFGGSIQKVAVTPGTALTVTLGGDSAGLPLLTAAADVWSANGGKWYSRGFRGMTSPDRTRATAGQPAQQAYAWVEANTGGPATGNTIGRDAFVVIVSKNCKIANVTNAWSDTLGAYDMTTAAIAATYQQFNGYSAGVIQAYTFDGYSGSRAYFTANVGAIPAQAVSVINDYDMVEQVAADPYGMGYCSVAFADPDRVNILAIAGKVYPNQNPKYRWTVPDSAAETQYPLIRNINLVTDANGYGSAIRTFMQGDASFRDSPLYKTAFFTWDR